MALTPDWVDDDNKQLFVINHAWDKGGERIEVFDVELDSNGDAVSLQHKYAMGALEPDQQPKDSDFQKDNYGRFNGLAVIGKDEVLLGKWIGPYILPEQDGYKAQQNKGVLGETAVVWMKAEKKDDKWETEYHDAVTGLSCPKSIACSDDGSLVYVTDTILQQVHIFKLTDDKKLVEAYDDGRSNVFVTTGRIDNMKAIEGGDSVMGGSIISLSGNLAFEEQRKGETWGSVENVPECVGGAEEFRVKEDGSLESRNHVVSGKINGWSNAAKVGQNVVCGSWIDENFLVCPFDEDAKWRPLDEPSGHGGFVFFIIVMLGLDIAAFTYQLRKIDEKDTFLVSK